jgi:hypothetical protein
MAIQPRFRILVAALGLAAAGLSTQAYAQTVACTGNEVVAAQYLTRQATPRDR